MSSPTFMALALSPSPTGRDEAEDWVRCDHRGVPSVRVANASQAAEYNGDLPHAAATVCASRACILDALAWVERQTGEHGVWIDAAGLTHINPPTPVNAGPKLLETYNKTRAMARRSVVGQDGNAPRELTRGFNIGYDIASPDWPLLAAERSEVAN